MCADRAADDASILCQSLRFLSGAASPRIAFLVVSALDSSSLVCLVNLWVALGGRSVLGRVPRSHRVGSGELSSRLRSRLTVHPHDTLSAGVRGQGEFRHAGQAVSHGEAVLRRRYVCRGAGEELPQDVQQVPKRWPSFPPLQRARSRASAAATMS